MPWTVLYHNAFAPEMEALPEPVLNALLSAVTILAAVGPLLGRPHADTLSGSNHANMKELRFNADDGVWRVAYAFDPVRRGIVLVAGDKAGLAQKRSSKGADRQGGQALRRSSRRTEGTIG